MIKNNRDAYAQQCKEDLQLKSRIKDILILRNRVGSVVNDVFYLVKDEVRKVKDGR